MPTPAQFTLLARRLFRGARLRLAARWRPSAPASARPAWHTATQACGEALLHFGRDSDREFTALAQGLAQLHGSLADLRRHNTAFQLVLEDRDGDRPLASAHAVYKRSVDLVHSSIGIAVAEQEQMRGIEACLLAACGAGAQFQRNQLLLRIITMSIRMEASRMDPEYQSIFLNVGDAVGQIATKIMASSATAFQRIACVVGETALERSQLAGIETDLHARAQSSIATIQHELTALQTALQPCAAEAREIASLLAQTEPVTLRTLSSLQHQDIVRQQLEHVAAGFNDLGQHLATPDSLEPGYLHHAAGVQQAHLVSARHEIATASAAVVAGLTGILEISTPLVARFDAMEAAGAAAFAEFRIITRFREGIAELSRVADRSQTINANISQLVTRVEEVVRVFAEEVVGQEIDVKIVALNAQIAAARVPSADALNRLAEETSRVSDENTAVTRRLVADLQAGLGQLRALKTSADEFLRIVTDEKRELETGVAEVTAKLTHLSQSVQSSVTAVHQTFAHAHHGTSALLQNLGLDALIARTFPPAEALCAEILQSSTGPDARTPLSDQATARLDAHRRRYTMQKEVATHASALGAPAVALSASAQTAASPAPDQAPLPSATPSPTSTPAPPAPATPTPAEDLGDGIELF